MREKSIFQNEEKVFYMLKTILSKCGIEVVWNPIFKCQPDDECVSKISKGDMDLILLRWLSSHTFSLHYDGHRVLI